MNNKIIILLLIILLSLTGVFFGLTKTKVNTSSKNAKIQNVKVDDINVAYKRFGKGDETIVTIMGYAGTMDLWNLLVLDKLAEQYQIVIFDNRGMGLTSASEKEFSIDLFADDVNLLMEKLNISNAHILGWSMGTEVALSFAVRYPEKLNKLILYAADCSFAESVQPKNEDLALITSNDPKDALRALIPDDWLAQHPDPSEYFPQITEKSSEKNIKRQDEAMRKWAGVCNKLYLVKSPTLLITGTKDILTPPQNSLYLVNKIPNASLVQIPGGGHGLMFQYPDQFSDYVFTFLGDSK